MEIKRILKTKGDMRRNVGRRSNEEGRTCYIVSSRDIMPFYPSRVAGGDQEKMVRQKIEGMGSFVLLHAMDLHTLVVVHINIFVLSH